MTLPTTLTMLALADGMHFVAIGALVYYLSGTAPVLRAALFLTGLVGVHVAGGALLIAGWSWIAWSPPRWWMVLEWGVVIGLLVLVVVRVRRRDTRTMQSPARSLTLPATVLAGATVSLADLAIDVPYHLAAARIVDTVPTLAGQLVWLAYFNAVYLMPMIAAALVYMVGLPRVKVLVAARRSEPG